MYALPDAAVIRSDAMVLKDSRLISLSVAPEEERFVSFGIGVTAYSVVDLMSSNPRWSGRPASGAGALRATHVGRRSTRSVGCNNSEAT